MILGRLTVDRKIGLRSPHPSTLRLTLAREEGR